jgi:hypothetical protein
MMNLKKAVGKDSAMAKRKTGMAIDPLDVKTNESDGESALQALEAQEQSQGAHCGQQMEVCSTFMTQFLF